MNSIQNGINGEVFFVTTTVVDCYRHSAVDYSGEKGLLDIVFA